MSKMMKPSVVIETVMPTKTLWKRIPPSRGVMSRVIFLNVSSISGRDGSGFGISIGLKRSGEGRVGKDHGFHFFALGDGAGEEDLEPGGHFRGEVVGGVTGRESTSHSL